MNGEELRAMTAAGPDVVLVERKDMLAAMDENARLRRANHGLHWMVIILGCSVLWLAGSHIVIWLTS